MADRTCSIEGCERGVRARGWCSIHYQRWHKHGDPLPDVPLANHAKPVKQCSIDGCDRIAKAHGWCGTHYARWLHHGDTTGQDRIFGNDEARFWSKVDRTAQGRGCAAAEEREERLANAYDANHEPLDTDTDDEDHRA